MTKEIIESIQLNTLIIMRALPGAGKSTFVSNLKSYFKYKNPFVFTFSADYHFLDENDNYVFKPEELGLAHKKCMKEFLYSVMHDEPSAIHIIDNTNINLTDFIPYVRIAQALELNVKIIQIETPLEICLTRNTHNVPEKTMISMAERLKYNIPKEISQYIVKINNE